MSTHTTPNFASILDESPTEIERTKPLPPGTYLCVVGDWEQGNSSQKKTLFIKFNLKPIAAEEDVDPEALEELGGLEGKRLSITHYIPVEDGKPKTGMITEFHVNCGIDLEDGASIRERNDKVKNAQILAVVSHRIDDKDPSRVYAEVRRTAKAD